MRGRDRVLMLALFFVSASVAVGAYWLGITYGSPPEQTERRFEDPGADDSALAASYGSGPFAPSDQDEDQDRARAAATGDAPPAAAAAPAESFAPDGAQPPGAPAAAPGALAGAPDADDAPEIALPGVAVPDAPAVVGDASAAVETASPAAPSARAPDPGIETATIDVEAAEDADASGAGAAEQASAQDEAQDDPPADAAAPSFDLVRVGEDGSAVVAGRAAPDTEVRVLIDGEPSETVRTNSRGEFVALIDAPESEAPSLRVDLETLDASGARVAVAEPVIVALPDAPEQAPVVLQPAEDSIRVLQPAARAAADAVTIDAVSYDEEGEVVVAGRGAPGAMAMLYVDNALSVEALIGPNGDWRAEIPDELPPALYVLRVDQVTDAGVVSSRAETPFERAAREDIVLADGGVIVQPGNNLWTIADFVYGDGVRYTVIYQSNRDQIRDPDLIYPGQVFSLPDIDPAADQG